MNTSPTKPPPAPKTKPASLPDVEDGDSFGQGSAVDEHTGFPTDIASLTPAQLYELNLGLFNESLPDRPLIDEIAPISELRAEYENGSPSFVQQISWLEGQGFHSIRRTRGDGDCFYRSTAFAFVERLIHAPNPDSSVQHALSTLEATLPMLKEVGFEKLVYDDFYEALVSLVQNVLTPDDIGMKLNPVRLLEAFQKPEISNSIVVYLRLVTSAQIRLSPFDFRDFLFHPETAEQMDPTLFCEHFVEATGKEADHVQMTALCRALRLNVDVAYLDGRRNDAVDFVQFREAKDQTKPLVLLYRPGHYDILVGGR
ncbi:putative cysteine proteinase [Lyophyllum shimeji]|uniref:ubiquitinyl hydrolase 1 n=1 Tax=Lyophyllum shimeji TaxID=47721 RepID=A0A9P3PZU1_LYOSH|nr:putative cysteine proteinase [Lyophyllum shimeji]